MVEVRNVSDDCCCSYRRGCVEVDMWVCYVKWKKSEKGDGVGGVVLGEGGTALEGGGGKKCVSVVVIEEDVLRLICGYAT